jgi:hypothetical protein
MKQESQKNNQKYELSLAMKIVSVAVFLFSILIESLLALAILLTMFLLFVLYDAKLNVTKKEGEK